MSLSEHFLYLGQWTQYDSWIGRLSIFIIKVNDKTGYHLTNLSVAVVGGGAVAPALLEEYIHK